MAGLMEGMLRTQRNVKIQNSQIQDSILFMQSHLLLLLLVTLSELPLQVSSKKVPCKCCNTLFPLIRFQLPKIMFTSLSGCSFFKMVSNNSKQFNLLLFHIRHVTVDQNMWGTLYLHI